MVFFVLLFFLVGGWDKGTPAKSPISVSLRLFRFLGPAWSVTREFPTGLVGGDVEHSQARSGA